ncbi:MAG: Ig-like domain-containing protein, partial [Acidobacteriota bacterium]
FGTSNWSTASDDNQLEVNYFTTKDWFYRFFADQFEWKWNNRPPDGSTTAQTTEFVPLPPDAPSYRAPAKGTTGVNPGSVTLTWYAGPWARKYDLYLGTASNPVPMRTNVELGPSQSTSDYKSFTVTGLAPGTTYAWKIVSRTMADVAAEGPLWTFTTAGAPVSTPPSADATPPSVVVYSPGRDAALGGTTDVSASAWDNLAVVGVQFKVDGINVGAEDRSTPFRISWDTTLVSSGPHEVTAEARDNAGNRTTSAIVRVTVANDAPPADTVAPSVTLTAPADGSVLSGTTSITADSADDVGLAAVQFMLDDVPFGAPDQTAPYAVPWDTTSAANGPHTLGAVARDAAGNLTIASPVSVTVVNTVVVPPPSRTVVIRAADVPAENIIGNWVRSDDASAADGVALWNSDGGAGKIAPALIVPKHYLEISFQAEAGTPYHLWMRLRAQNNYFGNDSLHVQFYDAVDAAAMPIYRVGSTGADNSAQVVLQESDGGKISGWGWADQGWNGLGTPIYFTTTGPHTLRIQQREDGVMFDQIVLSPDTYSSTAPGSQNNDTTVVPR